MSRNKTSILENIQETKKDDNTEMEWTSAPIQRDNFDEDGELQKQDFYNRTMAVRNEFDNNQQYSTSNQKRHFRGGFNRNNNFGSRDYYNGGGFY
ncbi:hypothetical protein BB559_003317 [Furculomyces boomerangus]|uniref:Uncharacterized protein n=1 Tax=Furculomyces boomerangus TaxID=61424 RepID=A0A2T9YM10_9FUNG|nr:hypothetical protein BB559_003317 [Furculomyces boomerangus]